MKKLGLLSLVSLLSSSAVFAAVSPTSVQLKIYGMWIAASADCSSPIEVFTEANPGYTNFTQGASIGSGRIPEGTYNCVIMKMSDQIKVTPESTIGGCAGGVEYTQDVCQSGSVYRNFVESSNRSCSGSQTGAVVDDTVFLYLSTSGASSGGGFVPPTVGTAMKLQTPLVVSAGRQGRFSANFSNKIIASGTTSCDCQPPDFGFTSI